MNGNKSAAGTIIICSSTRRVLLNLRAPYKSHKLTWSLWGGMMENNEGPMECLHRELIEEMGFVPEFGKFCPFDIFQSEDKKFLYHTYICVVDEEFIPTLNKESCGYCWTDLGIWPKPMHYGAKKSLCSKKAMNKLEFILKMHS